MAYAVHVYCNCANNKHGLCYGKANTAYIESVMEAKTKVIDCPGYVPPSGEVFEGEIQGDRKINPDKQTDAY